MSRASPENTQRKAWFAKPGCIISLVVGFALAVLVGHDIVVGYIERNRPTHYEFGSDFPLDELPPSARDVRFMYHKAFSPWGRAYEFRCTESDFRDWVTRARSKHPELSEIREGDRFVDTALPIINRDGTYDEVQADDILISDWRFEDQGLYFAFDRATGRAVTWSHSR